MATIVRNAPVTIREVPGDGWLLYWGNDQQPEHHEVAMKAMAAVRERDGTMASAGVSCVTVITWDTVTRVGEAIAKSFGGSRS